MIVSLKYNPPKCSKVSSLALDDTATICRLSPSRIVGCVPSHCRTRPPASFLAYTRSVTRRGSFKASQTVTDCGSTRRSKGPERISGSAVKRSDSGVQDIANISPDTVTYTSTIPSLHDDVKVN